MVSLYINVKVGKCEHERGLGKVIEMKFFLTGIGISSSLFLVFSIYGRMGLALLALIAMMIIMFGMIAYYEDDVGDENAWPF